MGALRRSADVADTSEPAGSAGAASPLLAARDVRIQFPSANGWMTAVDGVSFELSPGRTHGLVGESGCGKSATAASLLGLTGRQGGRVVAGSVEFDGVDLLTLTEKQLQHVRGTDVSMIFQQPERSLNPAFTVGEQIAESLRHHRGMRRRDAWKLAVDMLEQVGIRSAAERAHDYPHMFSGGMCQRVMIAIALSCDPRVLIADEPTTALDVTVQASVLELLKSIQAERDLAMLFISHDLAVIAQVCDTVSVMYAGKIVEHGPLADVFRSPKHPYTQALMETIPTTVQKRRFATIEGIVPRLGERAPGCRFLPRCPRAQPGLCEPDEPTLQPVGIGHSVSCVRAAEPSPSPSTEES